MKLMERVRTRMRCSRYSPATESAYCYWIKQYLRFHGMQHPSTMGADEIAEFLSDLVVTRGVSASTQNQALSGLLYLYREILQIDVADVVASLRGRRAAYIPEVLSRDEVIAVLGAVKGRAGTPAKLLYGSGLRVAEALNLRLRDVDFERNAIIVRSAKGGRPRRVPLPPGARADLEARVAESKRFLAQDWATRSGGATLPQALDRKYPKGRWNPAWQFVFPSEKLCKPRDGGAPRRHHLHPDGVLRALRRAAHETGVRKRVTCHLLRHTFATHLLERGVNIRRIQELMGHKHLDTTMGYTHVAFEADLTSFSPLG